jgi:hypothetical protein
LPPPHSFHSSAGTCLFPTAAGTGSYRFILEGEGHMNNFSQCHLFTGLCPSHPACRQLGFSHSSYCATYSLGPDPGLPECQKLGLEPSGTSLSSSQTPSSFLRPAWTPLLCVVLSEPRSPASLKDWRPCPSRKTLRPREESDLTRRVGKEPRLVNTLEGHATLDKPSKPIDPHGEP